MDWTLLLCFIWINLVSIQALNNFNDVDSSMLQKYLHSKYYQNPFTNAAQPRNPPRKTFVKFGQDGEPIYAVVEMDIVNSSPNRPRTKKPLTYHGNDKWSMSRKNQRYSKRNQGRRGKGGKLKPGKRAFVSYEELSDKITDFRKPRPGVSLLQSVNGNRLESAGNFPVTEKSSLVYGNPENLGIRYGKSNEKLMFSNFRKTNNQVDLFNTAIPKSNSGSKQWIVLEITPKQRNPRPMTQEEEKNNASEMLDESSGSDDEDYRRKSKHEKKGKFRKRDNYNSDWKSANDNSSSSSSSDGATSSSYEKNEGNPYTVHKGKYRQNWLWNHVMDGDHMNINPYGPLFNEMTATAQDLFFGRKWWYFNQDDYKPMG